MHDEMTDWGKSVAVVVLHEGLRFHARDWYAVFSNAFTAEEVSP